MKKIVLFIVLLIITNIGTKAETNVIVFNNGYRVYGMLVPSPDTNVVTLKLRNGSVQSYSKAEISSIKVVPIKKIGSFGIGFGIPYGFYGLNADFQVVGNLNVTAGIGHTLIDGIGYSAGLRYCFLDAEHVWRPRITVNYGVNNLLLVEDLVKKYYGWNIGAGCRFMFGALGKTGFDADLIYVTSNEVFADAEKLEKLGYKVSGLDRFQLSLGFRFGF
ncbi:MAG: hypothetical protein WCR42_03495 [bacterium]